MKRLVLVLLVCLVIGVLYAEGFCQSKSTPKLRRSNVVVLQNVEGEITAVIKAKRQIVVKDAQGNQWLLRVPGRIFESLRVGLRADFGYEAGSYIVRSIRFKRRVR
ncbi:MAG: hypothetical protein PHT59_04165 [Candidatus Omnitrophica bacterium]|nr:hypothetical protein [Candidatus Omnitrophota bacterium]